MFSEDRPLLTDRDAFGPTEQTVSVQVSPDTTMLSVLAQLLNGLPCANSPKAVDLPAMQFVLVFTLF